MICLKRDINDFLKLISDTEIIKPDDRLSTFLNFEQYNELSESELDMVSAAAKPDYEKFKLFLESKGIK